MRRAPIALLFALAALAIIAYPSTANAITLKRHVLLPHGITHKADRHEVVVTTVAPADSDDDGCPNTEDSYTGPGCVKPAPVAVEVSSSVAPAPATTSVASSSVGGCPSYMAGEASSPTAVNPTSGATGCFQILPSTHDALGCTDYGTSCAAKVCAAQGNDAWVAADPCAYIEP